MPLHFRHSAVAALLLIARYQPAAAQDDAARELAELRDLVRQQARALQAEQQTMHALELRLQSLEAAQRHTTRAEQRAPARSSGPEPRPHDSAPAEQVATAQRATPLSPPGTIEATPRLQTTQRTASVPPTGQPPLPVLSGNDRIKVTVSGQVNRSIISHADGSGKIDNYFTDNNTSSTRLRVLGSAALDEDTTVVSAVEFDLRSNSSISVSRQTANNNGGGTPTLGPFRVRRAEIGIQSEYGNVLLGRGSAFTDGISEFDLSGTDVAFYAYLPDSAGGLQFANRTSPYRRPRDPTISQVYDDFSGPRDDRIRYDSPPWRGLVFGGTVGQGGYYDVGVKWAGEVDGTRIAAGLGFMNYNGTLPSVVAAGEVPQDGTNSPTTPFSRRTAGAIAFLLPNGINGLVSAGWAQHYRNCCGDGPIVRRDATNFYVKAGYQVNLFSIGKTDFSIDGGQTRNRIQDGDIATRFGLQFDQPIIAKGFEFFGGWEHIILHRVGARFRDGDIGMVGSRVQF